MPELPEVEIVKQSLSKLINKKIVNIKICNTKLRYKISSKLSKVLINQKILKILRRSKYLIFFFKKNLLLAHLGMTGKFILIQNKDFLKLERGLYCNFNQSSKHDHIYFHLNDGFTLVYNDIRKFGFLKIYKKIKLNNISFLKNLGPEPLSNSFNINYFQKYTKNKKKNIKNLLMDQKFVSGLGNIYVNESLFLSKIHPLKCCNKLKEKKIDDLIYNIKKVLNLSISRGGSSIKNFKNVENTEGYFQQLFNVYGHENDKCARYSCNGMVKRLLIANRSCFYCNKCQKLD